MWNFSLCKSLAEPDWIARPWEIPTRNKVSSREKELSSGILLYSRRRVLIDFFANISLAYQFLNIFLWWLLRSKDCKVNNSLKPLNSWDLRYSHLSKSKLLNHLLSFKYFLCELCYIDFSRFFRTIKFFKFNFLANFFMNNPCYIKYSKLIPPFISMIDKSKLLIVIIKALSN